MEKEKPMWVYFSCKIKLRNKLVGGWPKNPETVMALLKARGLEDLIPEAVVEGVTPERAEEMKQAAVQRSWTGFRSNSQGLYVESRQVKAMLKEGANVLKPMIALKNAKSKLAERVFVEPQHILLGKKEPDGVESRVVHAMTMQGPRSSMKLYDYVEGPELEFRLRVLNDGVIKEDALRTILEYAEENGLGADRSQGFGQFDLVEFRAD